MIRLNVILMLAAAICALGLVTAQHKARKLFQALEAEQERSNQLRVEYDQLQLEMSTWAGAPRVEQIARDKLKMRTPDASGRIVDRAVVAPQVVAVARKPVKPAQRQGAAR